MGRTSCGTGKRFVMCPRYCEIFGPGACAGVFDEKECVMSTYREESLLHTYGGTRIYIPTLRRAKIRARDMDINAERDELARKGLSERALVARLATLHGLSERQVWRILKQPRTSDNREAAS
nr:MAG TPA: Mor transcription activator family [Caudoviricetes sp.]